MSAPLRIVVLGTLALNPFAGMAWMHMQIVAGLRRLGHDVYYFEITSKWPYDPLRRHVVDDSSHPVAYLARVADSFGLGDRWAYRRSYSDSEWFGLDRSIAEDLLAHADLVLNVTGATRPAKEGLEGSNLVLFGTDPGPLEVGYDQGDEDTVTLIDAHKAIVTYGENVGNADCPLPALPRLQSRTRQPVLLDLWHDGPPSRSEFTTVCNWKQGKLVMKLRGTTYFWSKHHEFLKFADLPARVRWPIELAIGRLGNMNPDARTMLQSKGWQLVDGHDFSTDPWGYRDYVRQSRAEFTVAKDLNVRLRTGWFSERSACYLAAGRPVVTQDTGFGKAIPTGEGLFAFTTLDEVAEAFEAINSDYERHSRAARGIAEEYFHAEKVLATVLDDLGF